jgi:outer membrane protein FlgP
MKAFKTICLMLMVLASTGCASVGGKSAEVPSAGKTLRATGYSRFDDSGKLAVNQRWLQAQQAAKLDAYRGLADLLYQEKLGNQTTVGTQVMRDEVYRVYLDSYLREARAADYRTIRDSLKTTLELHLSPRFYRCMSGDTTLAGQCLQEDNKLAFTRLGYKTATVTSANLACGTRDCSDQYYVSGFSKKPNVVDDTLLDAGLYDVEWIANTGLRTIFQYLLINGFYSAL